MKACKRKVKTQTPTLQKRTHPGQVAEEEADEDAEDEEDADVVEEDEDAAASTKMT